MITARVQLKKWKTSLAIAITLFFFAISTASAHTVELLRSEPSDGEILDTSPSRVRAWFNEELQTSVSTISVVDAGGIQVDHGDGGVDLDDPEHAAMLVTLPALADGVYTVRWHAVLLDGDATDGEFSFTVGAAASGSADTASSSPAGGLSPSIVIALAAGLVVLVLAGVWVVRGRNRR